MPHALSPRAFRPLTRSGSGAGRTGVVGNGRARARLLWLLAMAATAACSPFGADSTRDEPGQAPGTPQPAQWPRTDAEPSMMVTSRALAPAFTSAAARVARVTALRNEARIYRPKGAGALLIHVTSDPETALKLARALALPLDQTAHDRLVAQSVNEPMTPVFLRLPATTSTFDTLDRVAPKLLAVEVQRPFRRTNQRAANMAGAKALAPGESAGLSLTGRGLVIGIWDEGAMRTDHVEMEGRVTVRDSGEPNDNHATHVGGTIASAGTNAPRSKGTAPEIRLNSFDFNTDMAEIQSNTAYVTGSNHSYGPFLGWGQGGCNGKSWFGGRNDFEDSAFGKYGARQAQFDALIFDTQHVMVWSAGNDRSDSGVTNGTTYYLGFDCEDPIVGPDHAFESNIEYDTLGGDSIAKNVISVGSVNTIDSDSPTPGQIQPAVFSSFGPMDDGRIKPDLAAPGTNMYSTWGFSADAYNTESGTSMSVPVVSGIAALLNELYRSLNGGIDLTAAQTKAVLIQTAREAGTSDGPDYRMGWGLVDANAAAALLSNDGTQAVGNKRLRTARVAATTKQIFQVSGLTPAGGPVTAGTPVRLTMAWIDPAGATNLGGVDDPTPALANDLDMVLVAPDGQTKFYPWSLSAAAPKAAATRAGPNRVDNVERIDVSGLENVWTGQWTVEVTVNGPLKTVTEQTFALAASGTLSAYNGAALGVPRNIEYAVAAKGSAGPFPLVLKNLGSGSVDWTLNESISWLTASRTKGTLGPSGDTIDISVNASSFTTIGDQYATMVFTTANGESRTVGVTLRILDCVPDCTGRNCGADPVCGQSCGSCAAGALCDTSAGQCRSCIADPYEPDDALADAKPLTLDDAQARNLCSGPDLAKLVIAAPATFTIMTDNLGPVGNTRLFLMQSDGVTVVASNDDDTANRPGTKASRVDVTNLAAGTYYVLVIQADGQYGLDRDYALRTFTGTCVPACEGRQCGDNGCGGSCGGCNDQNGCTDDSCGTDGRCVYDGTNQEGFPCSDGRFCTTGDLCIGGVCTGQALDCSGLDSECAKGFCNEQTEQCERNTGSFDSKKCSNGLFCVVGSCSVGQCQNLTQKDCNDGQFCTNDSCDEDNRRCVNAVQSDKCFIAGECYVRNDGNPQNVCQICDPNLKNLEWSAGNTGASCGRAICSGGVLTLPMGCGSDGECAYYPGILCAPYAGCKSSFQCADTCTTNAECKTPAVCFSGACRNNKAPVAEVGQNQRAAGGATITLDGRTSYDPDNDPITFAWVQTIGPRVTIDVPSTSTPQFVAPKVEADTPLEFELYVSDAVSTSAPATTRVDVAAYVNSPPRVNAGPDLKARSGDVLRVTAIGFDEDGASMTYRWSQEDGPAVTLDNPATASIQFTVPQVAAKSQIVLTVIANDGEMNSPPDSMSVIVTPGSGGTGGDDDDTADTGPTGETGADTDNPNMNPDSGCTAPSPTAPAPGPVTPALLLALLFAARSRRRRPLPTHNPDGAPDRG
jgi:subtilisin family serine protease